MYWRPRRVAAARPYSKAEPLTRLACGGYRGGFGVGVATQATAIASLRPRIPVRNLKPVGVIPAFIPPSARCAAAAPEGRVVPLSPQAVGLRFTAAAQAAGLERRVTAHSGRVGLASELTALVESVPAGAVSAFATEELEIAVATQAGTPEKILDDERRNRPVSWDDQGSLHTRLGVGQMISMLTAEHKALLFKDGDEVPVVQRTKAGHLGRQVDAHLVERYVLRRQPSLLVAVARLL